MSKINKEDLSEGGIADKAAVEGEEDHGKVVMGEGAVEACRIVLVEDSGARLNL